MQLCLLSIHVKKMVRSVISQAVGTNDKIFLYFTLHTEELGLGGPCLQFLRGKSVKMSESLPIEMLRACETVRNPPASQSALDSISNLTW